MRRNRLFLALFFLLSSCSNLAQQRSLPFQVSDLLSAEVVKNIRWNEKKALENSDLDSFFKTKIQLNEMMQTPNVDPYFGERKISANCLLPNRPESKIVEDGKYKLAVLHSTATSNFVSGLCSSIHDKYKVQQLILNCKDSLFEVKIYYPIAATWITEPLVVCK